MSNGNTHHRNPLGVFDATTLIVGSMIGSGIFIAPAIMSTYIQTPGLLILMWLLGGLFTICGALSLGSLAAAIPKMGGPYVFLRMAYSPIVGFLYGWTAFLVIQSGVIAAVSIAFAKYLGAIFPIIAESQILYANSLFSISSVQLIAICAIIILSILNIQGIKLGALVQNIFTVSKVAALLFLIAIVFIFGGGSVHNFTPVFTPKINETLNLSFFAAFAVAMSKALFAYDAWNSVSFVAEEIRNPRKNLPLALLIGTSLTTILYTLSTVAYLYIVPIDQMAQVPEGRIAATVAELVLGNFGKVFIVIAILISTFGCINGIILLSARLYYSMAKDRLFFEGMGKIHPKYETPSTALVYQCIFASLLTLSGTYSDLLTYAIFGSLLFNALTIFSLFILRKKMAVADRPAKIWGYPFTPLLYVLIAILFIVYIFIGDLRNSGMGLLLILSGIPFYFFWKKK